METCLPSGVMGNIRPSAPGDFKNLSLHTVRLHEDALTIIPLGHSIRRCTTVPSGGASVSAFTEAGSCLGLLRSPLGQKKSKKKDSIALAPFSTALCFLFYVLRSPIPCGPCTYIIDRCYFLTRLLRHLNVIL